MKKMKENKNDDKSSHGVETPEPPQVKDPSKHPSKQYDKGEKKQSAGTSSKKSKAGGEKLTPNEEL